MKLSCENNNISFAAEWVQLFQLTLTECSIFTAKNSTHTKLFGRNLCRPRPTSTYLAMSRLHGILAAVTVCMAQHIAEAVSGVEVQGGCAVANTAFLSKRARQLGRLVNGRQSPTGGHTTQRRGSIRGRYPIQRRGSVWVWHRTSPTQIVWSGKRRRSSTAPCKNATIVIQSTIYVPLCEDRRSHAQHGK